jgi:hypothetical protein
MRSASCRRLRGDEGRVLTDQRPKLDYAAPSTRGASPAPLGKPAQALAAVLGTFVLIGVAIAILLGLVLLVGVTLDRLAGVR